MKIFRRILSIILGITIIFLLVGFLLPRKVYVERQILINAEPKSIFNQINTLKKWEKWSPWLQMETKTEQYFSGPVSGLSSKYKWQSSDKNVGTGSVTIISSVPFDSLEVLMDFGKNGKSIGKFILLKENIKTIVTWSLSSDLGMNPLSRWFGLFSDQMIGPDLERGLLNLEQVMVESRKINGYEIVDNEVPARILISVRDTASTTMLPVKLSKMYNKLSSLLKSKSLPPTGPPLAIFYNYSKGFFDVEASLPVASVIEVPKGLKCIESNAQKTIMVKYFGPYRLISSAYNALGTYINENEVEVTGPGWEEYITNPTSESDTNKWQTNIYYPVN